MSLSLQSGLWSVDCAPDDGARLIRLSVAGRELLTGPPARFRPPVQDCGRYETRPVFGYDDCFPTVDACAHPDGGRPIPDHGDLCWQPWQVSGGPDHLAAETTLRDGQGLFRRRMDFRGATLRWSFSVLNRSDRPVRFLHVMHALMPIDRVCALSLPRCAGIVDEVTGRPVCAPGAGADWLLRRPEGTASMILLRQVAEGRLCLHGFGGGRLVVRFPHRRFPNLAVWWNRGGHPDEEGLRRRECAFEPLAGPWSSLARSAGESAAPSAPPGTRVDWSVEWTWKETSDAADS